jgi:hypothetical protein
MKHSALSLLAACSLLLAACGKKSAPAPAEQAPASPPAAQTAPPAAAATPDQAELAKKQALMDYATMEDQYLNDAAGQWASAVKASSTFGEEPGKEPSSVNAAANMVGKPDGKQWTNANQNMGFDWVEASFAKPVHATEFRAVFERGKGVEAVSKLELQDTEGKWYTVWSGISTTKRDERGDRTWLVRSFPATTYTVKAAKLTIANNLENDYKVIDALQLVGN